jgi:deferrochelatase/peroxidase EfeB
VQAIAFGSLKCLVASRSLLLRLPDRPDYAKSWLRQLLPMVSFDENVPDRKQAVIVGLTQTGIERLGLSERDLETFPVPFQHGSTERARSLGDVGPNAPCRWVWGGESTPVDAIVMLYAADHASLQALEQEVDVVNAAWRCQGECDIKLKDLPSPGGPIIEPFWFVDGVSQPRIRGTARATANQTRERLLEPGEMILGYPDGLGFYPPTPTVSDEDDPDGILTEAGMHPAKGTGRERNLGRNGTFLVVRQLEQDVERFAGFVKDAAAFARSKGAVPPGVIAEAWIEAKMVGR